MPESSEALSEQPSSLEQRRLSLEEQKARDDARLRGEQIELEREKHGTDAKAVASEQRTKAIASAVPLVLAIIGAWQSFNVAATNTAAQIEVERRRNEAQLVLKAVEPSNPEKTVQNLKFLQAARLIYDPEGNIAEAAVKFRPTITASEADTGRLPEYSGIRPVSTLGASARGAKVIEAAIQELGFYEGSPKGRTSIGKYLAYVGLGSSDPRSMPWSAAFTSYCLRNVEGLSSIRTPQNAQLRRLLGAGGCVVATAPSPGDIFFRSRASGVAAALPSSRSGLEHSGIVLSADGDRMVTVEGNVGDAVRRRTSAWRAGSSPISLTFLHIP